MTETSDRRKKWLKLTEEELQEVIDSRPNPSRKTAQDLAGIWGVKTDLINKASRCVFHLNAKQLKFIRQNKLAKNRKPATQLDLELCLTRGVAKDANFATNNLDDDKLNVVRDNLISTGLNGKERLSKKHFHEKHGIAIATVQRIWDISNRCSPCLDNFLKTKLTDHDRDQLDNLRLIQRKTYIEIAKELAARLHVIETEYTNLNNTNPIYKNNPAP